MRHAIAAIVLVAIGGSCSRPADGPEVSAEAPPACPPAVVAGTAPPCATGTGAADVDLGSARAVALAASDDRACALLDDGGVMCWGDDSAESGSTPPRRALPERIAGLDGVVELTLGRFAGCARRATGQLSCWGWGDTPWHLGSAKPSLPGGWTHGTIAVGWGYACVLRDRAVTCSGNMIPDGMLPSASSRIADIAKPVAISAGINFACAIEAGGSVACWGGHVTEPPPGPDYIQQKPPVLTRAVRVESISGATALGLTDYRACAVHRGGEVACWAPQEQPTAVENLSGAYKLAVGYESCAIHGSGSLSCWGRDWRAPNRATPVPGIDDAIDIALGPGFGCVLRASGRVRCWGRNDLHQLGIETMQSSATPVVVCGLDHVTQVATGYAHACAVRESGDLYCWGGNIGPADRGAANDTGDLRDSVALSSAVPTRVPLARKTAQVVADEGTTCALDTAGKVACWGNNPYMPRKIKLPTEPVSQISLGKLGLCGVTPGGSVTCNGSPVAGVGHAIRVRAGDFACAEVVDGGAGRLRCWGIRWAALGVEQCHQGVCKHDPAIPLEPVRGPDWPCGTTTHGDIRCRSALAPTMVGKVPT